MVVTGKQLLAEGDKTISGERKNQYGQPENSFNTIADYWTATLSAWFGEPVKITPELVGLMMVELKVARQLCGEGKIDNYVDMIGYAALAGEMYSRRKEDEKRGKTD